MVAITEDAKLLKVSMATFPETN